MSVTLNDYINQLKTCPDSELTSRLGVYDNYPILLGLDFNSAKIKLLDLQKITHIRSRDDILRIEEFNYDDGMHTLSLNERPYTSFLVQKDTEKKILEKKYGSFLFLHPYQKKNIFNDQREMSDMIIYLSEYFLKKNEIPAFFPGSNGYSKDDSKLVFYEP